MNPNSKKLALAALLIAGGGFAVAFSQQDEGVLPPRQRPVHATNAGPITPEAQRRLQEWTGLQNEARKAERQGDYPLAESLFRQAAAVLFAPGLHQNLARLYDAQGREREAFAQYRLFLADHKGYTSSAQDDPRLLARYGDLCLRFSTLDEAAQAFSKAASRVRRDPAIHEPDPEPRNESFAAIRAAAYTAVGMDFLGGGDHRAAMPEFNRAVAADPDYWVPRFYRAREYGKRGVLADAVREAAVAERLAPLAKRELVLRMRARRHIPDPSGKLIPPMTYFRPDPDSIWKPSR